MLRFTLFLSALLLAACQKAPPPAAATAVPAEPVAQPAPADARPVIAAFGDSLTAGFGVEAGLSYGDFLQKELDAQGHRFRVVNLGISGDTTTGGLNRVEAAIALQPRLVILELGGNDGLRGLPLDETRRNLNTMIERFQKAGAKVVLAGMTLPPNYGPDYVRRFESIYVELARQHKLTRIPFFLDGVWNAPGMMQADGIHPTAAGNAEVARRVARVITPLLR